MSECSECGTPAEVVLRGECTQEPAEALGNRMQKYRVWDALDSEEEYAEEIEACNAGDAAEVFASEDRDGNADGIYEDRGHVISVRSPVDGQVHRFEVSVDYHPTYSASLLETP